MPAWITSHTYAANHSRTGTSVKTTDWPSMAASKKPRTLGTASDLLRSLSDFASLLVSALSAAECSPSPPGLPRLLPPPPPLALSVSVTLVVVANVQFVLLPLLSQPVEQEIAVAFVLLESLISR